MSIFDTLDQIRTALAPINEMKKNFEALAQPLMEMQKRIDEIYKPIQENFDRIVEVLQGFSAYSQALKANEILIKNQFVFTDALYENISEEILASISPEAWVENYYFEDERDRFNSLLNRCKQQLTTESKKRLLEECEQAYQSQHYHLACVGLFSLADGILSEVTENQITSVALRMKTLHDEMLAKEPIVEYDVRFFFIFNAMCYLTEENDKQVVKVRPLFEKSDFNAPEPDILNRHWVVHGRTDRAFTRLDVLRILQWIDGLFYLVNPPNK